MTVDFFKFPHTPHLKWLGAGVPRDDKVMSPPEADALLQRCVVVEEKVDGTNLGFSTDAHGGIRVQNRGNWVRQGGHPQFDALWGWLALRQAALVDALGDNLILFGEWCLAVHSVQYDSLPDWFLGFDVYDRRKRAFWSVPRRDKLLRSVGLAGVQKLASGLFSVHELEALLSRASAVGGRSVEGIYIRADEGDWLKDRAKIVRAEFTQAIEEHWSKRRMERNRVALQQDKPWQNKEPSGRR